MSLSLKHPKKDNSPFGELFFFYSFLAPACTLCHRVSEDVSRLLTATYATAAGGGCREHLLAQSSVGVNGSETATANDKRWCHRFELRLALLSITLLSLCDISPNRGSSCLRRQKTLVLLNECFFIQADRLGISSRRSRVYHRRRRMSSPQVYFLRIDYIPPTVDYIHFFEMITSNTSC